MSVLPGIDVLLRRRFAGRQHLDLLVGRRVGLIGNASAVTHDLTSDVDALRRTPDVQLVALFGPEHGFYAVAADGAAVGSTVDSHTRLPVHSLYGEECKPTAETLTGIDVLVFDIQSVGVRFYTYVTTLLYVMQAATEYGVPLVVCDRPNPIGGEVVEGPILERGFESFVGPGRLPIRHGMTVGELARLYNKAWEIGVDAAHPCDLTVVPCAGWKRAMWFDDTGLPWVPPSPAMPWPTTAIVYPGTCLIEGTNLSEGRGTALPFHLVGAPWIDGWRLAKALNQLGLPGVRFRSATFWPATHKWAGRRCGGVQLHVNDRRAFRPVTVGLHLIATVKALYPNEFAWRKDGERAGDEGAKNDRLHIDLLAGTDKVRRALDDGVRVPDLIASWKDELDQFVQMCRPYYLYE